MVPPGPRQDRRGPRAARPADREVGSHPPAPRRREQHPRPVARLRLRLPRLLGSRWGGPVREMIAGHPALPAILEPLLLARAALRDQLAVLDNRVRDVARADEVCRRLMTVPGVGAVVALTIKAAVDRPEHSPVNQHRRGTPCRVSGAVVPRRSGVDPDISEPLRRGPRRLLRGRKRARPRDAC